MTTRRRLPPRGRGPAAVGEAPGDDAVLPPGEPRRSSRPHARAAETTDLVVGLLDRIPAPAGIIDERDGRFLAVNAAAERLYGYRASEFKRLTAFDVVEPAEIPRLLERMRSKSAGWEEAGSWRHRRKDGSGVLVDVAAHPWLFEGRPCRLLVCRPAEAPEIERLALVGELASGAAHDLNNYLAAMRLGLALLSRELPEGHAAAREAERVQRIIARAAELTRRVQDLAHGRRPPPGPVDLVTAVHDAVSLVRSLVQGRIGVRVDVAPATPPVHADRAGIDQVVLNLLLNARDAMPEGGLLTLTVGPDEERGEDAEKGGCVKLEVRDTGVGMSPEAAARVFERGFTTKGAGRGVGLAVVRGLVESFGGTITLDTSPGRGTTFRVVLPATDADPPSDGLG